MAEDVAFQSLVDLLNCEKKRDLEKHCRSFVLNSRAWAQAIQVAMTGGFAPYLYASCFRQWAPDHLNLKDQDLAALSSSKPGPFKQKAKKAAGKIFQIFEDRRMMAAHLLYTPDHDYWFLFYFDQRDTADPNGHWKYGPHVHLVSHHWPNLRLNDVWQDIQNGRANFPSKIHLRYQKPNDIDEDHDVGEDVSDQLRVWRI